jgi:hypothetical protein
LEGRIGGGKLGQGNVDGKGMREKIDVKNSAKKLHFITIKCYVQHQRKWISKRTHKKNIFLHPVITPYLRKRGLVVAQIFIGTFLAMFGKCTRLRKLVDFLGCSQ